MMDANQFVRTSADGCRPISVTNGTPANTAEFLLRKCKGA
jgi:hypothetical protein